MLYLNMYRDGILCLIILGTRKQVQVKVNYVCSKFMIVNNVITA